MGAGGWMGELVGESWRKVGGWVVVWVSGMGEWIDGCWGVDRWVSGGVGDGWVFVWVSGDGWRAVGQRWVTVWAQGHGAGVLWGQTDR